METVGFIGLGAMGVPMARNIHKGGYPLRVFNRSPGAAESLKEEGVMVCESPGETAGRSDVIIIMVTGSEALLDVIGGPNGVASGLTKGKIVVNMSTVSPRATARAAELVAQKGAVFVDAPVSGSVKPAEDASLVILAGGDNAALAKVKPILLTMGKQVIECGKAGQGTHMKLVLNLMLGNLMQSLAEAMMLGKSFQLDPEAVLDALDGGAMAAPMFQAKGRNILKGDYTSQFPVHLMFKDLNLVLNAGGDARIPLPQTAATRECFSAAMARGHANDDMAAVVKCLEALTGKTIRD